MSVVVGVCVGRDNRAVVGVGVGGGVCGDFDGAYREGVRRGGVGVDLFGGDCGCPLLGVCIERLRRRGEFGADRFMQLEKWVLSSWFVDGISGWCGGVVAHARGGAVSSGFGLAPCQMGADRVRVAWALALQTHCAQSCCRWTRFANY